MSERSQLVASTLDHALDRARDRARENMDRWGLQDVATLILCMTEELGEISREQLGTKLTAGTDLRAAVEGVSARLKDEALDLAALCFQLIVLTEICVGPEIAARSESVALEGRRLDSTDYPRACGVCLSPHWRPMERAEDRRLVCCHEDLNRGERDVPVGSELPAWCPAVHLVPCEGEACPE